MTSTPEWDADERGSRRMGADLNMMKTIYPQMTQIVFCRKEDTGKVFSFYF